MPKPWAKYEVNFIHHDKFRAIPANAICLWLEGKSYADDKLSDGFLPAYEVKHWRFYSKTNIRFLTTPVGNKPGTTELYAPLWEVRDGGWQMHDYLAHNDDRGTVLARKAKQDDRRRRENERLQRWRDGQKKRVETPHETPVETPDETHR